jgi:hypothetical protein
VNYFPKIRLLHNIRGYKKMNFTKIFITFALVFSLFPITLLSAEDSAYSQVEGNPFVKNKAITDFKLPSTPTPKDDKFNGFDYNKASQFNDKLNIKNKTRPYSPYQKTQAFNGSEIDYNREFGAKDAMDKFKEIEADLTNKEAK